VAAVPAPTNAGTDDTIYALSSGRPPAAIAVVRVSGSRAGAILAQLTGRMPYPRRATLATLRDEASDPLDRALILWFPGPASATGEDCAEFHLHGGIAVTDAVLAAIGRTGARLAEPGEFTRRALFNGRLNIAEVEGLADLLAAETEAQRREALRRSEGALGRRLRGWTDRIVTASARIEAAIDYDGDVGGGDGEGLANDIDSLVGEIDAALCVPPAERLRDGVRVAIVGPVNAGKSSLFNALLGSDAAIVSTIEGTTRDLIERPVAIGGIPLVLIDTAGLRESSDPIEREGIGRAAAAAESADLLLDLSEGAQNDDRTIAVAAKADLSSDSSSRRRGVAVSVQTGEGMSDLIERIISRCRSLLPGEGDLALDRRYRAALVIVREELVTARDTEDSVLAAEHLRTARVAMDRLVGGADFDSMLDALFGRFCLGK
jgi:tRNA modification GTPase